MNVKSLHTTMNNNLLAKVKNKSNRTAIKCRICKIIMVTTRSPIQNKLKYPKSYYHVMTNTIIYGYTVTMVSHTCTAATTEINLYIIAPTILGIFNSFRNTNIIAEI
jgi:hypothetical protein